MSSHKDRAFFENILRKTSREKMRESFDDKNNLSLEKKIELAEYYNMHSIIHNIWMDLPKMKAIIETIDSSGYVEGYISIEYFEPYREGEIRERLSLNEVNSFFEISTYGVCEPNINEWKVFYEAWKDMKAPPTPR